MKYTWISKSERQARDRTIIKAAAQGHPPCQIAQQLGLDRHIVYRALALNRAVVLPPARVKSTPVDVPNDIIDMLGAHAARRRISPRMMARMIIVTVARSGLIDAVMDDSPPGIAGTASRSRP